MKALNGVTSDRSDPATIRTLLLGVSASNQSLDLTGLKGVGKKSEVEQVRTRRWRVSACRVASVPAKPKPNCDAPRLRAPQRLGSQTNTESYQAFPILVPLENVTIPLDFDPDFGPARHPG